MYLSHNKTWLLGLLHWLPVQFGTDFFKLILFVFKALAGLASTYLSGLFHSYQPDRSLRSSKQSFPEVPRSRSKLRGDRAFSVAGRKLWKSLPQHITSAPSLELFLKSLLKTHCFLLPFELTDPRVGLIYILIYFYFTLACVSMSPTPSYILPFSIHLNDFFFLATFIFLYVLNVPSLVLLPYFLGICRAPSSKCLVYLLLLLV